MCVYKILSFWSTLTSHFNNLGGGGYIHPLRLTQTGDEGTWEHKKQDAGAWWEGRELLPLGRLGREQLERHWRSGPSLQNQRLDQSAGCRLAPSCTHMLILFTLSEQESMRWNNATLQRLNGDKTLLQLVVCDSVTCDIQSCGNSCGSPERYPLKSCVCLSSSWFILSRSVTNASFALYSYNRQVSYYVTIAI